MPMTVLEMLWLFVTFAVSGWLVEFFYRSLRAKKIINPGFLKGPYLPIYGIGAVLIVFCKYDLIESHIFLKLLAYITTISGMQFIILDESYLQLVNFIIKCAVYFSVATALEFSTGFIFEGLFCMRLWDYSHERYCVKNYVCLSYSLYWLALALCFEYMLLPFSVMALYQISSTISATIIFLIIEVMLMDLLVKIDNHKLSAKARKISPAADGRFQEFMTLIEPLLSHPDVARLAQYKHHRETTRLSHCLEVAWISFLVAKKMSLNWHATARGALLHDLFFYDWLYEGPRWHGFRHPKISLQNAARVTALSAVEADIIKKHMWPLTPFPPKFAESWVVCLVDTFCTLKEYLVIFKKVYEE